MVKEFLHGFFRGLLRQTVRLVWFLVLLCIVLPFVPMITDAILGISINGESLRALLTGLFSEGVPSGYMDAAEALVTGVGGLVVFFFCFFFCKWLSFIFYRLTQKHLPQGKKIVIYAAPTVAGDTAEQTSLAERAVLEQFAGDTYEPSRAGRKVKKVKMKNNLRFAGGMLGLLFGFLIYIVAFMPLNGAVSTYMAIVEYEDAVHGTTTVELQDQTYAEALGVEDIFEFSISEFLSDNIPENIGGWNLKKGIADYHHSFPVKMANVLGFSNFMFDMSTKATVNGESVYIRREVIAANAIYNRAYELMNRDAPKYWKDWDWDAVEEIVFDLMDRPLVRSVLTTSLEYLNQEIFPTLELPDEFENVIGDLLAAGYQMDDLKQEISALFNIAKHTVGAGLLDVYFDIDKNGFGEQQYQDIIDILSADNYASVYGLTSSLYEGKLMNIAQKAGLEWVVTFLSLVDENNNRTSAFNAASYQSEAAASALANELAALVDLAKVIPFDLVQSVMDAIEGGGNFNLSALNYQDLDFEDALLALASVFDAFKGFPIPVTGTGAASFYELAVNYVLHSEDTEMLGDYFDLAATKAAGYSFADEVADQMQTLVSALNAAVDFFEVIDVYDLDVEELLDNTPASNAKLALIENLLNALQANAYHADGAGKQGYLKTAYEFLTEELFADLLDDIDITNISWLNLFRNTAALKAEADALDAILKDTTLGMEDLLGQISDILGNIADLFEGNPQQLTDLLTIAKQQAGDYIAELSDLSVSDLLAEAQVADLLVELINIIDGLVEFDIVDNATETTQRLTDLFSEAIRGGTGFLVDTITDPSNGLEIAVDVEVQGFLRGVIDGLTSADTGKTPAELSELQGKLKVLFGLN